MAEQGENVIGKYPALAIGAALGLGFAVFTVLSKRSSASGPSASSVLNSGANQPNDTTVVGADMLTNALAAQRSEIDAEIAALADAHATSQQYPYINDPFAGTEGR